MTVMISVNLPTAIFRQIQSEVNASLSASNPPALLRNCDCFQQQFYIVCAVTPVGRVEVSVCVTPGRLRWSMVSGLGKNSCRWKVTDWSYVDQQREALTETHSTCCHHFFIIVSERWQGENTVSAFSLTEALSALIWVKTRILFHRV